MASYTALLDNYQTFSQSCCCSHPGTGSHGIAQSVLCRSGPQDKVLHWSKGLTQRRSWVRWSSEEPHTLCSPQPHPFPESPQSTTLVLLEGTELTAAGVGLLQWTNRWSLVPKSSRKVVFHHGLAGLLLQPCKDLLP